MLAIMFAAILMQPPGEASAIPNDVGSVETVEEVREKFRQFYLARSTLEHIQPRQGAALGAFYNDVGRCIELASARYELELNLDDYIVYTNYEGPLVSYYFQSLSAIDVYYSDAARRAPVTRAFLCYRSIENGNLLTLVHQE